MKIIRGDLFKVIDFSTSSVKIIAHVCNDVGAWGAGFTRALDTHFAEPRIAFEKWKSAVLGEIQIVPVLRPVVGGSVEVINMVAQHGLRRDAAAPLRYYPLALCLRAVAMHCFSLTHPPELHCPFFGTGLAGGNENIIAEMIESAWIQAGLTVFIYRI